MKEKTSRISKFIESIDANSLDADSSSILMPIGGMMEAVGSRNDANCSNPDDCTSSINGGDCINAKKCDFSSNKGDCINPSVVVGPAPNSGVGC